MTYSTSTQIERTARAVRLALIAAFLLLLLWLAGRVLLEVFAGLLVGVMLHGLAEQLSRRAGISRRWAVFVVTASLLGLLAVTFYFLTPRIVAQTYQIGDNVALGIKQLSRQLSDFLPKMTLPAKGFPSLRELSSGFLHFGSTVTDTFVTAIIVAFVGFYAAASSSLYVEGFVRLFPHAHCVRVREILHETGRALQWWLFGRAIAMLCVAILTLIALSLLSIPLAVTLSLISGILTFIPYIGALISAVPAVLIGFVQSPLEAAYVLLVYVGVHVVEGYILVPLIQQRTVHMPPALMLCAQLLFGTLFGIAGVGLAAPLTVVVMVVTRILYLRDVLGADVSPVSGTGVLSGSWSAARPQRTEAD